MATKGTWEYGQGSIREPDDFILESQLGVGEDGLMHIRTIGRVYIDYTGVEEARENADLIIAAPEMLKLIKSIVFDLQWVDAEDRTDFEKKLFKKATQLILDKKLEGFNL